MDAHPFYFGTGAVEAACSQSRLDECNYGPRFAFCVGNPVILDKNITLLRGGMSMPRKDRPTGACPYRLWQRSFCIQWSWSVRPSGTAQPSAAQCVLYPPLKIHVSDNTWWFVTNYDNKKAPYPRMLALCWDGILIETQATKRSEQTKMQLNSKRVTAECEAASFFPSPYIFLSYSFCAIGQSFRPEVPFSLPLHPLSTTSSPDFDFIAELENKGKHETLVCVPQASASMQHA